MPRGYGGPISAHYKRDRPQELVQMVQRGTAGRVVESAGALSGSNRVCAVPCTADTHVRRVLVPSAGAVGRARRSEALFRLLTTY